MRLLLDSHAFLWFILGDQRLSDRARLAIAAADTDVLISPATLWEMAIKVRLGKYTLPGPFGPFIDTQLASNRIRLLPIEVRHTALLASMPFHHRDPFDRLIVAQALPFAIGVIGFLLARNRWCIPAGLLAAIVVIFVHTVFLGPRILQQIVGTGDPRELD